MTNKIFALLAISILAIFLVSGCIGVPEVGELGGNDINDSNLCALDDPGPVADDGTNYTGSDPGPVADDGTNYTGSDPGPVAGE